MERIDANAKPWDRPWWKPVDGQHVVFFYLIGIHIASIVGIALFPIPSLLTTIVAASVAMLGGLAITIAFHRAISHRAITLHPWLEKFLVFVAVFSGSGKPDSWVANHRCHHAKSDTEDDISSPHFGGFWWSHLRWLYQHPTSDQKRWFPEHHQYHIWIKLQIPIMVMSLTWGYTVSGWEGLFWCGPIRLMAILHGQCLVNSVSHLGKLESGDTSRNTWWLWFPQFGNGENWHRNHHARPSSARFGVRWWQVDLGWVTILALSKLGLVSNIKVQGIEK